MRADVNALEVAELRRIVREPPRGRGRERLSAEVEGAQPWQQPRLREQLDDRLAEPLIAEAEVAQRRQRGVE